MSWEGKCWKYCWFILSHSSRFLRSVKISSGFFFWPPTTFSGRLLRSLLCFKSLSRFPRFRKLKNLDHCARFSLESWKLEKSLRVEMVATRIANWFHLFESCTVSSVLDNFKAPFRIAYLNRICTNTSNWHWERGTCLKTSSKCSSQLLSWFASWKLQFFSLC